MNACDNGVLFLNRHRRRARSVLRRLPQPYFQRQLNTQWAVVFTSPFSVMVGPLRTWLLEGSTTFPMMAFQQTADEGWGYWIFDAGKEVASLFVNYRLQITGFLDRTGSLVDPVLDIDLQRLTLRTYPASDEYARKADVQFRKTNVGQFARFDVQADTLKDLDSVLTVGWFLDPLRQRQQVEVFKRLVNIREFDQIAHAEPIPLRWIARLSRVFRWRN
jgi:hypothetical protein